MITLNEDNLETVCRTCHAIIHEGTPPLADGLAFDADGNVIESTISLLLSLEQRSFGLAGLVLMQAVH